MEGRALHLLAPQFFIHYFLTLLSIYLPINIPVYIFFVPLSILPLIPFAPEMDEEAMALSTLLSSIFPPIHSNVSFTHLSFHSSFCMSTHLSFPLLIQPSFHWAMLASIHASMLPSFPSQPPPPPTSNFPLLPFILLVTDDPFFHPSFFPSSYP